ncbi:MAG: FAD-dependent monooxygenase [Haloarcula sp.]
MPSSSEGDSPDTDVVVVGAGPGGSTLAYLLARSGVEVELIERQRDLDRTFRGYLFQPLILRIFDEMDVLDSVLELPHQTVQIPTVNVYGQRIPVFDLSSYDEQYGYSILMEQPPLLRLLIERADEYDDFEYRDATTVQNLLVEDGRVVGVEGMDREAGEEFERRSRLVVGADGRYSTVREAAGIDPGLMESNIELIWFKLPSHAATEDALARFNDGGALGYFGLSGDRSQLGYFVEKGGYTQLQSAGLDAFYDEITGIDPTLDGILQNHVTGFGETTLLHIEPGLADEWVADGVLLLGDAAHVASPVGGQGNGLAIGDAVAAHSVICERLDEMSGTLLKASLREYEHIRRPTVEKILKFQRRGEWVISAFVRHHDRLPVEMTKILLRGFVTLVARSPWGDRAGKRFAWDSWEPVATSKFVDASSS